MRTISLWLLLLLVFCFSAASKVYAADYVWTLVDFSNRTFTGSSPAQVCEAALIKLNETKQPQYHNTIGGYEKVSDTRFRCSVYDYAGNFISNWLPSRSGDSCPANKIYDSSTGECKYDDPQNCAAKAGQSTNWTAEYSDQAAYDANPIRCTTSQEGCAVDVCSSGTFDCYVDGRTGKFVCSGKGGQYTGDPEVVSTGPGVDGCTGSSCEPKPPQESSSDKSCTSPTASNGVTTYTCVTQSNSNQWASSNCAVGSVNGVQGLHCTSPDYVPESKDTTKTDNTQQSNNADGGTTTTTESKKDQTNCKAGNCSSTSTTTTTTTTTNGNGETTGESSTCTGDRCDDPSTPGKDESQEEEDPEEVERSASGDSCSENLLCEGDAIDCAILRQQKAMRCSLDWDTQKGAVIAEASKAEYQLQEEEIDASGLFSGPSAGRWLSASCPADRSVYLSLTNSSITFSWQFVCQYASALGNLLVALASLFFAVYVGRAFGGD